MKIAILLDQLVLGGVQVIALKEAHALKRLGHQIDVLVLMKERIDPRLNDLTRGLHVKHLSDQYPALFKRSFKLPPFSFLSTGHLLNTILAPHVLKEQDYDIVIAHGSSTCLTAQRIFKKTKIPYLAFVHDTAIYIYRKIYSQTWLKFAEPFLVPIIKKIEGRYLNQARSILAQSPVTGGNISKEYAMEAKVIIPGCEPLTSLPRQRGNHLLALSRWSLKKDPKFLLRLLVRIPTVKIKVAGRWESNSDLEDFREQIKERNLDSRVELITSFDENQKLQLFKDARAWIHPHTEAFGMGALTAASCGCPIIMPQGSGAAQLFQHGESGFFPNEGNLGKFIEYTQRFLLSERTAWKMGYNAWKKVKDKYTWENHARKIIKTIKEQVEVPFVVLETAHVSSKSESGGDKVFKHLLPYLPSPYQTHAIIPPLAMKHWQNIGNNANIHPLPPDLLPESKKRPYIFINYLARIYHSTISIRKIDCQGQVVVYSSTNIFPDVLPAWLYKKLYPRTTWIARVHHLTPPPRSRPGSPLIKTVIYFIQRLALQAMKKADLVLVLNQELKRQLLKKGFSEEVIEVSGAGIDFREIANHTPDNKNIEFDGVFLGRLHPSKGIFDLPLIWKKVIEELPHAKLAIIGTAPEKITRKLRGKFQQCKVPFSSYKVCNYLSRQDLLNLLKKSRVFIFSDHEAGWGIAAAEAMACGLPVVGYDLPIFGSIYHQGFISVPQFDTQQFGAKIVKLLKDSSLYQKISQEAKEQAQKLDWANTGKEFGEVIKGLDN